MYNLTTVDGYYSVEGGIYTGNTGNLLNGVRTRAVDRVNQDLGGTVRLVNVWLSIFAQTSREAHMDLSGIEEDEDGFWNLNGTFTPWPGHHSLPLSDRINCLVGDVEVSGQFCGAQRAWYDGIVTEIVTASGGSLTCTPNHPIVTRQGLVGAGDLQPGNEVMTYGRYVNEPARCSLSGEEVKYEPAPIEKVFEAFLSGARSSGSVKVRRADLSDFYGDGESIEGDIDVVRANWELLTDLDSSEAFNKSGNSILIPKNMELAAVTGAGSSGLTLGGIGGSTSRRPSLAKMSLDELVRCVITPFGSLRIGMATEFDSRLPEGSSKSRAAVVGFVRDAEQRFSGNVSFDQVIEVRNVPFCGHVYDLQSDFGHIAARNPGSSRSIATGNCYCSTYARFDGSEQEALQFIGDFYGG